MDVSGEGVIIVWQAAGQLVARVGGGGGMVLSGRQGSFCVWSVDRCCLRASITLCVSMVGGGGTLDAARWAVLLWDAPSDWLPDGCPTAVQDKTQTHPLMHCHGHTHDGCVLQVVSLGLS